MVKINKLFGAILNQDLFFNSMIIFIREREKEIATFRPCV
jgi:hypothetical protein